jgi:acetyl-CoA acetyltransferase
LPKALKKANLTNDDIALWEINEAFSVVIRAAEGILKIDPAKINVNGCVITVLNEIYIHAHPRLVALLLLVTRSATLAHVLLSPLYTHSKRASTALLVSATA